jgi:CheY-like chemotaxis protein
MKKKIFIADDDRTVLDVLKMILDKAGYKTETTLSGKTLLNNVPDDSDLILLDVRMSGIDGLVICKHLKSMEATRNIPIIMVSAVPELETLAENAGADDFLEKPFNMSALLHIVAKYI